MNWKPINTAPRDGTTVLLFYPGLRHPFSVGRYEIFEHFSHGVRTYRSEGWQDGRMSLAAVSERAEPTHWAELYAPHDGVAL